MWEAALLLRVTSLWYLIQHTSVFAFFLSVREFFLAKTKGIPYSTRVRRADYALRSCPHEY